MWRDEWLVILRKSNFLQSRGVLFSAWFYPVYNFLFRGINPIFEKDINFLSLAPIDFIVQAIQWLSIPQIRNANVFSAAVENDKEKIVFCKKLLLVLIFHNLFLYGRIDPDIFLRIGDDDGVLIVIASAWPIELEDKFLYISFPFLTEEKSLFLKSYIWYFLRKFYQIQQFNNPAFIVPLFALEKFPGLLVDKIPNDF